MRPPDHSLEDLADGLAGTFPGAEDAPLAVSVLRALAKGRPLTDREIATAAGRTIDEVARVLSRGPNVQRDEHGCVVAFGGLSLLETSHRFETGGRRLFTWCAWDTLLLPALLGRPATVRSTCPITGSQVCLEVTSAGVGAADPEDPFVSFPPPGAADPMDITGSFCCRVHFLAGPEAASVWLVQAPGSVVLSLEEAFRLGRLATANLRVAGTSG